MFIPGEAGESTSYWEHEWEAVDAVAVAEGHRARPGATMRILNRYVPQRGRVLEVGCGPTTYGAALRSPDRHVVGIDLTPDALATAAGRFPDIGFVRGDIRAMPFADGSFDCVFSIGVVEHLETGPVPSLAEHARVLAPDGVALISVPWISVAKWAKDRWNLRIGRKSSYRSRGRLVTNVPGVGLHPGPGSFHQYEFSASVWHGFLREAGFDIVRDHRYLVAAGIGEIPLGRLAGAAASAPVASAPSPTPERAPVSTPTPTPGDALSGRRRLSNVLIQENASSRVEAIALRGVQQVAGHMCMTVARRRS